MNEKIAQIAAKIKAGGNNVVFTGAGISTESCIPDYRSQGGIRDRRAFWDAHKIITFVAIRRKNL